MKYAKILKKIYHFLSFHTHWWNLLISCVDSNISYIVFFSFIQFNVFQSFSFQNKLNMMVAIIFMAVCLLYSLIFYPLSFRYIKKQNSMKIL
jgi:Zn-dependent membrane protease YugP